MLKWAIGVMMLLGSNITSSQTHYNHVCIAAYNEVRKQVAEANGQLYQLHKSGAIDYDQMADAQNNNVNTVDFQLEIIRQKTYVGTAEHCLMLANQAKETLNWLMKPYATNSRN